MMPESIINIIFCRHANLKFVVKGSGQRPQRKNIRSGLQKTASVLT